MQYRIPALALVMGLAAAACSPNEPDVTPGAPTIELFEARPDALTPGQSTSLWWRTQLATAVRITDASGAEVDLEGKRPEADSVQVTPRGSTTYTLHATSGGKTVTATVDVQVEGTPTVEHFVAIPETVLPGEASTLNWRVKEADHLRILQGDEVLVDEQESFSGSLEVEPERTTSYTLIATFGEAETTAQATVRVQPLIDAFELDTEGPVAPGTEIELTWSTRGADALTLSNLETTVEIDAEAIAAGSATLAVGSAGTFVLVARAGELEAKEERTIEVMPLPRITTFFAPDQVVATEEEPATITVRWEVQDATEIHLMVGEEEIIALEDAQGELELTIAETTVLRLEARNAVGSVEMTGAVEVLAPAAIVSFTADPEVVLSGDAVTLAWEVEDASYVTLTRDGEEIPVPFGVTSVEDRPEATATYELRAHDALGGSAAASLEVLVVDALISASLQATPAAVAVGEDVTLSWIVSTALPTWDVAVALEDETGASYDLSGADPRAGSIVLPMGEVGSRVFTLTATSMGATATAQATVQVAQAPVVVLTATPEALTPSELATEVELSWVADNTTSLEIFERKGDGSMHSLLVVPAGEIAAGSLLVQTLDPITFVAEATSSEGVEASEQLVVGFGTPTVVSFVASATEVQRGASVTFTWDTEYGEVRFGDLRAPTHQAQLPYIDVDELGGQTIGLKDCFGDCEEVAFPQTFSFPFDGALHTGGWVSIHGMISLDADDTFADEYFDGFSCSPHMAPASLLAPYWSYSDTVDAIYLASGSDRLARQFVVLEWRDSEIWWNDGSTFQAVLFDDGSFDFRYQLMDGDEANGEEAWIGYRAFENVIDLEALVCNDYVPGGLSGKSYRFFGPPPATGSHTMEITASGTHELCVRGFGGQTDCETISITVVD